MNTEQTPHDTRVANSTATQDHPALLRQGVEMANIPTLLMVLYQFTGDDKWLNAPYLPGHPRGIDDNDSGRLSPELQQEIRSAALIAIEAWRQSGQLAVPRPSDEVLVRMLSVSMTDDVPQAYGPIIASGLGLDPSRGRSHAKPIRAPAGFRALIIGGGISGICAAVRLQEAGIDFEILEKNQNFGGTWWGNRYPGSGVDTPNHLYSYSFAQFDWPKYFSLRGEIHEYVAGVAHRFGLQRRTRFSTSVQSISYDAEAKIWHVDTQRPDGRAERLQAHIVISAVGVLDIPKLPDVPGLDSFPGPVFHTAHWPADLDIRGKRVAVVGNGASAMQVVPAIADDVESMVIFARSRQWAAPFPKFKAAVPEPVRALMREVPLYQQWYRQRLAWTFNDRIHPTLQKDPDWPHPHRAINAVNDQHREVFTDYIRQELGERQDLLHAVLPDYPPFGKRMLLDNGWYRTVARPHVELLPERLKAVDGRTLIGASGEQREADVLVLATGFSATDFLGSLQVEGSNGLTLRQLWGKEDARAYLGTTVPGFPNLFTLLGPNIGLGHGGSIIGPVEAQMDYILDLIGKMLDAGAAAIEPRQEVYEQYNQRVDAAHDRMVFTHEGMENWYRNSQGRIVAITPWRHDDFWRMTRNADLGEYLLHPRVAS